MQLNSFLTALFLLVSIGTVLAAPQFPLPAANITDQEIYDISNQIWDAEAGNRLTVGLDWQGTNDSGTVDNAPGPLCTGIPPEINTNPLYSTLQGLFDDYIADENFAEDMSPTDVADIDAFMTQVTSTWSMQLLNTFLASKGLAPSDPVAFQAQIKDIWFTLYVRQGTLGSSGGEHVLLGEIQSGKSINGLHNWVRFCTQEAQGAINYLGFVARKKLAGSWLIRTPFYWGTSYQPSGAFFIGTSPASDLALFTLCFYSRPNAICNVQLDGISVPIQTYTLDYNGGTYVGSAYPAF